MKRILSLAAFLVLISCNQQEQKTTGDPNASPFEAGGKYDQELSEELKEFKKEEERIRKENEGKLTDVEFEAYEVDFGKVKVSSVNKHYFVFQNTGNKPLIIESVRASCGCTTPVKPERPVQPGRKDSILVEFSPYEGTSGQVEKTVTVKSNTFSGVHQLFIKAVVE